MKFITQIRARPPPRLLGAAPQEFGDEIVGFREVGEAGLALVRMPGAARVVPIISRVRGRLFGAGRVDLASIVSPPLLLVRQQIVGGADLLELILGALVARVEVRCSFLANFR